MLHDALSQDAQSTAPLNPNAVWNALTSAIDKPSTLGPGVQVAGDNVVPDDGKVDESYGIDALVAALAAAPMLGSAIVARLSAALSAGAEAETVSVADEASEATLTGERTENTDAIEAQISSQKEIFQVIDKALKAVGNDGTVVSSRSIAEQAGEQFVGEDSISLVDRQTGEPIGQMSADRSRAFRYNNANGDDPYINLENKSTTVNTTGNLHVRWSK